MGWLAGSSTLTPTTRISLMRPPPHPGVRHARRYTRDPCFARLRTGVGADFSAPRRPRARSALRPGLVPGEEDEPELADLDLVAVGEDGRVDRLPVDVGPVEAADVDHDELARVAPELRVPPGDRDVVEEDVAVRVPARARGRPVQQEARSGVRAAAHDQQGRPGRERVDPGDRLLLGGRL